MTLSACEPQRDLVWGQAAAAKPKMWSSNMVRGKRAAEMQGQGRGATYSKVFVQTMKKT